MATKKEPAEAVPTKTTTTNEAPATATKGRKGIGKPVVLDEDSPGRGGIDLVMSRTAPSDPANS